VKSIAHFRASTIKDFWYTGSVELSKFLQQARTIVYREYFDVVSLSFSLVLTFVRYASSNFIIEHLLRLSWFLGISQITEIKEAPVSLEDTPASCFRARSLFPHRTLNCFVK